MAVLFNRWFSLGFQITPQLGQFSSQWGRKGTLAAGLIAEQGSSYITFTQRSEPPGSNRSLSDCTAASWSQRISSSNERL